MNRKDILIDCYDIEKKIEELRTKSRITRPQDKEARRFLVEQLRARGFNTSEIAYKLGLSRRTFYDIIK